MALSFRFGTVGSPAGTPKKTGGSVGAVLFSRSIGLLALELGWVRAVRVSEQTCEAIREASGEQDVALSVHAPYFININADDEEWPKSRRRLMDAAHYGRLAGATDIIFHPGSYFGRPAGAVLKTVVPRLQACVDELRAAGSPVTLRPETMGKPAMLGSLEDTLVMGLEVDGVEPCLDFAHLHARPGDGTMNTYAEWAHSLEAYARALGEASLKRLHIHISGIEYGEKGERKHLPLAEADIDETALLKALNDFNCGGRILSESPIMEQDALNLKKAWMEISREGE
ncbi:MAG: TIM barrel protein [Anaerolineales bacterium]|nr:TIM barrel protein [Anaerolineales bacterium]